MKNKWFTNCGTFGYCFQTSLEDRKICRVVDRQKGLYTIVKPNDFIWNVIDNADNYKWYPLKNEVEK